MAEPQQTPFPTPPLEVPSPVSDAHLSETEVHLLDYLNILYRHRRGVITTFLIVLIVGALQTFTAVPLYRAQARLLIQDERSTAVVPMSANDPLYWQDPEPYYQTQYRILQSRGLARHVVRRPEIANAAELNGRGPQPPSIRRALDAALQTAWSPIAAWLSDGDAPRAAEPPAPDETVRESALIGAFLGQLDVVALRNTQLVDVFFTSSDPDFAARGANVLAEEYVQQNLERRLENVRKTADWLTEEIARQQQKVQASERALGQYRSDQNALALEERQNIVVSRLNQLNDAVTRARTARMQKETLYNQVRAIADDVVAAESLPALTSNPYVQQLKTRLLELQREKSRLSEKYGERHPEMARINASLEDVSRQLRAETTKAIQTIQNEYESAVADEKALAAALEEQKGAAMDLSRKGIDYGILEREAHSYRQVYEQLLQREKELRVLSNSTANNVQIIDRAEVPKGPFSPNTQRSLLMAILAGLILAVGFAFGLEYLDDTIKTPDDITRKLRLPFLGLVPAVRGERPPVISTPVPHEFGEAFRALRTSVVFATTVDKTRTIIVTSAQPFEGKTTTACNLALVMALGGAHVLLIEGDMRRPGLHRTLGVPNTTGLSQVLSGQAQVQDAIQRTQDKNLFVITAGQVPPNPSELLASDRMKELLAKLADGRFDWIIIDTPPVLAVTDAVVLASVVSGVVFLLGSGMTRRRLALRAVETLQAARPRSLSVVLNRVDFNRDKYYYSRYYGYQYRSYYSQAVARV